jgi:hypothetical protein
VGAVKISGSPKAGDFRNLRDLEILVFEQTPRDLKTDSLQMLRRGNPQLRLKRVMKRSYRDTNG